MHVLILLQSVCCLLQEILTTRYIKLSCATLLLSIAKQGDYTPGSVHLSARLSIRLHYHG